MQRTVRQRFLRIGVPVVVVQVLIDGYGNGLTPALEHLPLRLGALLVVGIAWAGYGRWRHRRKRTFR